MLLQPVAHPEAQPRWLLNGYPKAGLHLLASMVPVVATPPQGTLWPQGEWWGVLHNIWTLRWRDEQSMRGQFWKLARLEPGQYLRSHVPYREDVAAHIDNCGIAHVFICRDLRDVAVSLAHHVLDDDIPDNRHTGKALYRLMDSFDDALLAIIEGVGPYAGIVARWQQYAPWLQQERVLCVRYEDVLEDRAAYARKILLYGLNRINDAFTMDWKIDPARFTKAVEAMVQQSTETQGSPTFRRGQPGEWRETFKPQHLDAFARCGGNEALEALGYEVD